MPRLLGDECAAREFPLVSLLGLSGAGLPGEVMSHGSCPAWRPVTAASAMLLISVSRLSGVQDSNEDRRD